MMESAVAVAVGVGGLVGGGEGGEELVALLD